MLSTLRKRPAASERSCGHLLSTVAPELWEWPSGKPWGLYGVTSEYQRKTNDTVSSSREALGSSNPHPPQAGDRGLWSVSFVTLKFTTNLKS